MRKDQENFPLEAIVVFTNDLGYREHDNAYPLASDHRRCKLPYCAKRGRFAQLCANSTTNTSSTADRTLSYAYGPEHQRVRENVSLTGTGTSSYFAGNTWYLNGEDSLGLTYEKEVRANGTTENKHYLMAGGQVFAVFTSRTGTLNGLAASTTSYFQHDQLGSIAVVTDENGVVKERLAYDPWGKRRNIMSSPGMPDTRDLLVGKYTNRGFTEHEHLDEIGMIHMNGRIYDPLIGRFMSADPNVTNPYDLRSFNRYSYVYNNPLKLFDPTGFDAWAHENSDGSTHYNPTEHGLGNLGGSHSGNSNNVASEPVNDPNSASGIYYDTLTGTNFEYKTGIFQLTILPSVFGRDDPYNNPGYLSSKDGEVRFVGWYSYKTDNSEKFPGLASQITTFTLLDSSKNSTGSSTAKADSLAFGSYIAINNRGYVITDGPNAGNFGNKTANGTLIHNGATDSITGSKNCITAYPGNSNLSVSINGVNRNTDGSLGLLHDALSVFGGNTPGTTGRLLLIRY